MILLHILLFIICCFLLFWSGSLIISALTRAAKFLGWREFIVAFFVIAIIGSLPNFFVGISSALAKIPELSFGDIVGGNVIHLTLAVGLAVLIGKKSLPTRSKMVQISAIFTAAIAVLPFILLIDGRLGRSDGVILILAFIFYCFWLFGKEERFKKIYNDKKEKRVIAGFKTFIKDLGKIIFSLIVLLAASYGIVQSSQVFSNYLGISLSLIGILIVGLGNALPETYFAVASARKGENWMILGDLMGSVIFTASFVLGIVVLITPIQLITPTQNIDLSPFLIARIFLIIAATLFLIAVKSDKKITRREAALLLAIYIIFVICVIFFNKIFS